MMKTLVFFSFWPHLSHLFIRAYSSMSRMYYRGDPSTTVFYDYFHYVFGTTISVLSSLCLLAGRSFFSFSLSRPYSDSNWASTPGSSARFCLTFNLSSVIVLILYYTRRLIICRFCCYPPDLGIASFSFLIGFSSVTRKLRRFPWYKPPDSSRQSIRFFQKLFFSFLFIVIKQMLTSSAVFGHESARPPRSPPLCLLFLPKRVSLVQSSVSIELIRAFFRRSWLWGLPDLALEGSPSAIRRPSHSLVILHFGFCDNPTLDKQRCFFGGIFPRLITIWLAVALIKASCCVWMLILVYYSLSCIGFPIFAGYSPTQLYFWFILWSFLSPLHGFLFPVAARSWAFFTFCYFSNLAASWLSVPRTSVQLPHGHPLSFFVYHLLRGLRPWSFFFCCHHLAAHVKIRSFSSFLSFPRFQEIMCFLKICNITPLPFLSLFFHFSLAYVGIPAHSILPVHLGLMGLPISAFEFFPFFFAPSCLLFMFAYILLMSLGTFFTLAEIGIAV